MSTFWLIWFWAGLVTAISYALMLNASDSGKSLLDECSWYKIVTIIAGIIILGWVSAVIVFFFLMVGIYRGYQLAKENKDNKNLEE